MSSTGAVGRPKPDESVGLNSIWDRGWKPAIMLLVAAFALRVANFGDTNLHVDEQFYFLVGQRMHDGILPYVGVWDRKPLGLFLIYYLIAGISKSVVAYQIVASLFAAATAMVVNLITLLWSGRQGGLLAGLTYLLMLGPFLGYGGQAPVFYNLFVAVAALLIVGERPRLSVGVVGWRVVGAMALCGVANTIKQTTLFDSVFFGLYVIASLGRAGTPPIRLLGLAAGLGLIGALPTLLIAGYYAVDGHWLEYWHAMVTSNLTKAPLSAKIAEGNLLFVGVRLLPILTLAGFGVFQERNWPPVKMFVAIWAGVSLMGCAYIPNFVLHYFLPALVPLSILSGRMLDRRYVGASIFAIILASSLYWHDPFDRRWTLQSMRSMEMMAATLKEHDRGRGLLVYDGPPYLYAMTGKSFITPLSFPDHLNYLNERNTSHIDTNREFDRILATRPEAIVMATSPTNDPVNPYTFSRVTAYIRNRCHFTKVFDVYETMTMRKIAIYAACR